MQPKAGELAYVTTTMFGPALGIVRMYVDAGTIVATGRTKGGVAKVVHVIGDSLWAVSRARPPQDLPRRVMKGMQFDGGETPEGVYSSGGPVAPSQQTAGSSANGNGSAQTPRTGEKPKFHMSAEGDRSCHR